jgi:hypothetical protein
MSIHGRIEHANIAFCSTRPGRVPAGFSISSPAIAANYWSGKHQLPGAPITSGRLLLLFGRAILPTAWTRHLFSTSE